MHRLMPWVPLMFTFTAGFIVACTIDGRWAWPWFLLSPSYVAAAVIFQRSEMERAGEEARRGRGSSED